MKNIAIIIEQKHNNCCFPRPYLNYPYRSLDNLYTSIFRGMSQMGGSIDIEFLGRTRGMNWSGLRGGVGNGKEK